MRSASLLRRALWMVPVCVAVGVGLVAVRPALGGDPGDDGVPAGTVAFFNDRPSCPTGWAPAPVAGRMIVGVTDPAAVGRTVGAALGDREDRGHAHAFTGTISLTPRAIAGADGSNAQGARATAYTVAGNTLAAPSGVPFIQLRACVKQ